VAEVTRPVQFLAVRSAILATAWLLVGMWGHIADGITRVKF